MSVSAPMRSALKWLFELECPYPPYRLRRGHRGREEDSTGVHRRVLDHRSHLLCSHTAALPHAAGFPTSEYYGGYAPRTPFG